LKYLLDTDTLIYVYKRAGNCLERLRNSRDEDIATSAVNLFELEFGLAKSDKPIPLRAYINEVKHRYAVLNFDIVASRKAGEIRAALQTKGTPIGPYDVQVAGVALANNLTIVTRNTREFERVPGLRVENWYD
jgi:tRNA(fMet)-specific endonuclease VapC